MCQPRAGGQLCSVKSSQKTGKQGGSVLEKPSEAVQLCTEGKNEREIIAKDFLFCPGHPSFLFTFQWGELSDATASKSETSHLSPGTLFYAPEEGRMDWDEGHTKKRGLFLRYLIKNGFVALVK